MKISIIQLPNTRNGDGMTGIYTYSRRLADALQEFVPVEPVEFRKFEVEVLGRRWGGLVSLYAKKWMGALPRADVVHAPHITHTHRKARVLTIHDLAWQHWPSEYRLTNRLFHLLRGHVRRMGAIVTPSHTVREEVIRELHLPEGRVHAAPLGVEEPPAVEAWRRERPYVVMVGELRPRKRSLEAIQAMQGVEGVDLVRVGPPMSCEAYSQECRKAAGEIGGRYQEAGYLSREELYAAIGGAEALLYPSLYEGFGLPPLEAASVGTPSVVGPAAVFNETLGDLAVRCDGSTEGIRKAIERVLSAPSQARELRSRASEFTWQRCAARHVGAYTEAVKESL